MTRPFARCWACSTQAAAGSRFGGLTSCSSSGRARLRRRGATGRCAGRGVCRALCLGQQLADPEPANHRPRRPRCSTRCSIGRAIGSPSGASSSTTRNGSTISARRSHADDTPPQMRATDTPRLRLAVIGAGMASAPHWRSLADLHDEVEPSWVGALTPRRLQGLQLPDGAHHHAARRHLRRPQHARRAAADTAAYPPGTGTTRGACRPACADGEAARDRPGARVDAGRSLRQSRAHPRGRAAAPAARRCAAPGGSRCNRARSARWSAPRRRLAGVLQKLRHDEPGRATGARRRRRADPRRPFTRSTSVASQSACPSASSAWPTPAACTAWNAKTRPRRCCSLPAARRQWCRPPRPRTRALPMHRIDWHAGLGDLRVGRTQGPADLRRSHPGRRAASHRRRRRSDGLRPLAGRLTVPCCRTLCAQCGSGGASATSGRSALVVQRVIEAIMVSARSGGAYASTPRTALNLAIIATPPTKEHYEFRHSGASARRGLHPQRPLPRPGHRSAGPGLPEAAAVQRQRRATGHRLPLGRRAAVVRRWTRPAVQRHSG